jgi:thioredoxin-related protein
MENENKTENKNEVKIEHKPEHKEAKKVKLNALHFVALALGLALIASLLVFGKSCPISLTGFSSANAIGTKTVDFINTNLIPEGQGKVELVNATLENGVYKIATRYNGNIIFVYASPDGKLLFTSPIDMSQTKPKEKEQSIPKTDKPNVKLFVMSFCPYGQQAEKAILPVLELLKDKIDFELHFIVDVQDNNVLSLHGDYEAKEDMRQACIIKNYGISKWIEYIKLFDNNCTKANIDSCWSESAKSVGIDTSKIESCVTEQGIELMKKEQELTDNYGVQGSPTLLINDVNYKGARTPDAYKTAICSGFTTEPSECSTNLSSSGAAASGQC